jgi:hypothetical protein
MLDLILDTSTDQCFVLICEKNTLLASRFFPAKNNLSSTLVPTIQELLESTTGKIERIFIGIGPGSYTGLRVGVSVANSLALSLDIPLYSFCSLMAFIPPSIPEGPFGYVVPSAYSILFLLQGVREKDKISPHISHRLGEKQDLIPLLMSIPTLISLDPEKSAKEFPAEILPPLRGSFHLEFLLSHLSDISKNPPAPPCILYLHSP